MCRLFDRLEQRVAREADVAEKARLQELDEILRNGTFELFEDFFRVKLLKELMEAPRFEWEPRIVADRHLITPTFFESAEIVIAATTDTSGEPLQCSHGVSSQDRHM